MQRGEEKTIVIKKKKNDELKSAVCKKEKKKYCYKYNGAVFVCRSGSWVFKIYVAVIKIEVLFFIWQYVLERCNLYIETYPFTGNNNNNKIIFESILI